MIHIEEMLRRAAQAGASDVHLAAGAAPRIRVDGRLSELSGEKLTAGDTNSIVFSIMNESQHNQFEEQGEYDLAFTIEGQGRYRVHAYRCQGTVALAFRLIPLQIPSPEELGFPDSILKLCRLERGLVLVTGLGGSGRSTTLAAMADQAGRYRRSHIITLEKPVEFLLQCGDSLISHRDVRTDSLGYARALGASVHEDPDVILVGELSDPETIQEAVKAAEAGCLVLSALHLSDPDSVPEYLAGFFPPDGQTWIRNRLEHVLQGVIAQSLVPGEDGQGRRAVFEVR